MSSRLPRCAPRARSRPRAFGPRASRPASRSPGPRDLALVFNEGPDDGAAGVFTRNQVKAAPVLWSRQVLSGGQLRAVILNSGGANACTGGGRIPDSHAEGRGPGRRAVGLGIRDRPPEVPVCSTGHIGERLPMDKVLAGVRDIVHALAGKLPGGDEAAQAIMTTDTVPKQVALDQVAARRHWRVGGIGKGAGMLPPSWRRCSCVLTTDAVADAGSPRPRAAPRQCPHLRPARRRRLLFHQRHRAAADLGCQRHHPPAQAELDDAVFRVCDDLCAQLQANAEGVTKRVAVTVTGAPFRGRSAAGRAVRRPRQPGQDRAVRLGPELGPGAGRRRHGADQLDADRITVSFNGFRGMYRRGRRPGAREVDLSGADIDVIVDLKLGDGAGHHPDHRPVPRLRRRELGLQLMTTSECPPRQGAVLAEALPWLKQLHGKIVVVKYGGNAMTDDTLQGAFAADMVFLRNCRHPSGRGARRRAADQRACSNGLASQASSRAACGSPPPRCSTSPGWCCSARSAGNWSA